MIRGSLRQIEQAISVGVQNSAVMKAIIPDAIGIVQHQAVPGTVPMDVFSRIGRHVYGGADFRYYSRSPDLIHVYHLLFIIQNSFDFVKCFALLIYKRLKNWYDKLVNNVFTEVLYEIHPRNL